ncbi:MAG: hypothetical protein RLZ17_609 [Actinomycetota bacterium]
MISLERKIVGVHTMLASAALPHAFGGALALAFHTGEPRGTRDIDVNIFLPVSKIDVVRSAFAKRIEITDAQVSDALANDQVRVFWEDTPIDIFFNVAEFHDDVMLGIEHHKFANIIIPVLGADALTVFKAMYNRTKDWADIEAMLEVNSIDKSRVIGWLVRLLGVDDPRTHKFISY